MWGPPAPAFQYCSFADYKVNIFLLGLLVGRYIFDFFMKVLPLPIIKIANIAEIVPDKYPEPPFSESALNLPRITETVVQVCARILANQIIQGGSAREIKKD